jgi:hypothetical protein
MPKLDDIQTTGALAEAVRRAVQENRVELLRDAETDAKAALVPWEMLLEWIDAGGPTMEPLRGRLQQLDVRQDEAHLQPEQSPESSLPSQDELTVADPENAASIALLQSWLEEDASDNPEEIHQAEEELEEFKRGINAERDRAGARRIYP